MKKGLLIFTGMVALFTTITVVSFKHEAKAQPSGISGYSGASSSCNSCHGGVAHTVTNAAANAVLTSDIPATGYVPGTVYNMVLTIKSKKNKVGFDLRAQTSANAVAGSFNTSVTNGQVMSNEIVHTSSNTITGGSKKVSFKWTAPPKGTGKVTYYASVATGINGTSAMDTLNKLSVAFNESTVTDVEDVTIEDKSFSVFPTVTKNDFTVSYQLESVSEVRINLCDAQGTILKDIFVGEQAGGAYTQTISSKGLANGTYLVHYSVNGKSKVERFFVEK